MKIAAYNNEAIWGVGETLRDALNDAKKYLDCTSENYEDYCNSLNTAIMTEALEELVEARGGNVAFGLLEGGRLGTEQEEYDEK